MRHLIDLFENNDPILNLIGAARDQFGQDALYGGNCGQLALAVATAAKLPDVRLIIICEDVFEDEATPQDIIAAELRLYHVAIVYNGNWYDGDGQISRDHIADWIEDEYGDDAPAVYNFAPGEPGVVRMINSETNWSISAAEFGKAFATLTEAEYHGEHMAPDREGGAPLYDLTANEMYPTDVYGPHGRQYYAEDTPQAFAICMQYRGRPNRMITVYRAIPRDAKPARINPGDWVALTRAYAREHGVSALNGDAKIVSKTVAVRDLYTEGNSLEEWGYDPQPNVNRADEDAIRARLGMETKTDALARGAARRAAAQD